MTRATRYKPLLFTTTLRNPERIKYFLRALEKYDEQVLTIALIDRIVGDLIADDLYKPNKLGKSIKSKIKKGEELTEKEVKKILTDNPQKHKEAGFPHGWASRFDTWFEFPKELGFVYYALDEKIELSGIGKKLVNIEHPEFEQQAFLNAFVKHQRNNPFRRVLNDNVPLLLLIQVIKKLNANKKFNDSGISKLELPLLIYWKDNDAEALYSRIVALRESYGFSPTREVIIDICCNEIMEGEDIMRNDNSILSDYPDEFIRKMRLTGLISLRGGGRFIDINKNEKDKVNYVIKHYSKYKKYQDEHKYFKYVSKEDKKLFSYLPKLPSQIDKEKQLLKWLKIYKWSVIKKELLKLSQKRRTDDDILKFISDPVRLEFLVALSIKSRFPDVLVIPNYPVDDEGLPTSTAPGVNDMGDIECFENNKGVLVEVTMAQGRQQTMMEIWPVDRHLVKFNEKVGEATCYFIAPSIFSDSHKQIEFILYKDKRHIHPKTIKEFVELLETNTQLYPS